MWTDLFPTSQELGISKHGQVWQYALSKTMSDRLSEADEFVKKCLISMITGKPEDFDSSWNKMQETLVDMKINEVGENISMLIKEKIKLWN